ncbi:hypothetical protein [Streptomyces sp. S.PNR 29]|uniref:hypothetical protein n=1 Tax=Streptomyces sp. S.PNR 29 TaxID=2973805 RepID=UPI0025AEE8B4|nr:hypothetical protein [Streptomyces sp. S.PNR 29]MDN0201052.1 hypothetical protein [Streptomyces sp. S.PNR 29]
MADVVSGGNIEEIEKFEQTMGKPQLGVEPRIDPALQTDGSKASIESGTSPRPTCGRK